MILVALTSIAVLIAYLLLIDVFNVGWKKTDDFEPADSQIDIQTSVSVVVCCKNEELTLPSLLDALTKQSFQNFQLVLVNDHSTDATLKVMQQYENQFVNIKLIDAEGYGKKNGLKEGILSADGKLILTTDADCLPNREWVETMRLFHAQTQSDLLIGPVMMEESNVLFKQVQQLEFMALVASGGGAAGANRPVLCNGANLGFTKQAWLESKDDLHTDEPSGDDIFLLLSIKKRGGVIRFVKSKYAMVVTRASETIDEFIHQRIRWGSKSPSIKDKQLLGVTYNIFFICLMQVLTFLGGFFHPSYWFYFAMIFIVKYFGDLLFLNSANRFFQLKQVAYRSLVLSAVYPVYIVGIALVSRFSKKYKWKGTNQSR